MFSFRTTAIEEQADKSLHEGLVACFCSPSSWDASRGEYLPDLFRSRGNLAAVFEPQGGEFSGCARPGKDTGIPFEKAALKGLSAVVVEIQDAGVRHFPQTRSVFRLMDALKEMGEEAPSLYIVDHLNPLGRLVEGSMPQEVPVAEEDAGMAAVKSWPAPRVPMRHGLSLGELAGLYAAEQDCRFPIHVISALARDGRLMPWTVPPADDLPGLFSCELYTGGGLWRQTNLTPGLGTPRPYEYIGAPFLKVSARDGVPAPSGVLMRPCTFTPSAGRYVGQLCRGYQLILQPGVQYHSLKHTLLLLRFFRNTCPEFQLEAGFEGLLADEVLLSFVLGRCDWPAAAEYIKAEEQKWVRKARKFTLYEDEPCRIK